MQHNSLFILGDTHGDTNFVWGMIKRAHNAGCTKILQLGDFGIWPGREGIRYLDNLEQNLNHYGIELYFIPGNHEDYNQLDMREYYGHLNFRPHIHYLPKGSRWEWEGVRFGSIGGAFSVDYDRRIPDRSWWPDAEEAHQRDLEKLGTDPLDVFISHDTPYAPEFLRAWKVSDAIEAASNRTRNILKEAVLTTNPKIIFHGHWHRRFSYDYHGIPIEAIGANLSYNIKDSFEILNLTSPNV